MWDRRLMQAHRPLYSIRQKLNVSICAGFLLGSASICKRGPTGPAYVGYRQGAIASQFAVVANSTLFDKGWNRHDWIRVPELLHDGKLQLSWVAVLVLQVVYPPLAP